jgi:DTW domain-containing protein YfiP
MHSVQRLFLKRQQMSRTVFRARGFRVERCPLCRIKKNFCICSHRQPVASQAAFLLLMYDSEVLKPSNTGRLIADLIPDTHAFLWSRTEVDPQIRTLIEDPGYQPYVVFPGCYAEEGQQVFSENLPEAANKRPLFILLDGTWREAKKMFRKSPYLNGLPLLSFSADFLLGVNQQNSRYHVRNAVNEGQLATAEVAALALGVFGEQHNAKALDLWFDVFSYHYQQGVKQTNKGNPQALERLLAFRSKTA